jgi:CRP/FNR family cyclic AMP-dependent transcriptional regulator
METIEPILAAHPFFKGLDPGLLKLVVPFGTKVSFTPSEFLCRENDPANQFYILYQGKVSVETFSPKKGPIIVQTLGSEDVLGRMWFGKEPYRWRFESRAMEITRAVALDVKGLARQCEEHHSLGFEIMKRYTAALIKQFRATRLQLLDMYGD